MNEYWKKNRPWYLRIWLCLPWNREWRKMELALAKEECQREEYELTGDYIIIDDPSKQGEMTAEEREKLWAWFEPDAELPKDALRVMGVIPDDD